MGVAIGSESSGSVRDVLVYNNTIGLCDFGHDHADSSCGWSPALHLKTTIRRTGVIENIVFDSNTVYNTTMFILLETGYQVNNKEEPPSYPMTVIRNIVFSNNRAFGFGKSASFHCHAKDACHGIQVVNNTIWGDGTDSNRNPWSCRFVESYHVANNTPAGLEDCMANSMNASSAYLLVESTSVEDAQSFAYSIA